MAHGRNLHITNIGDNPAGDNWTNEMTMKGPMWIPLSLKGHWGEFKQCTQQVRWALQDAQQLKDIQRVTAGITTAMI